MRGTAALLRVNLVAHQLIIHKRLLAYDTLASAAQWRHLHPQDLLLHQLAIFALASDLPMLLSNQRQIEMIFIEHWLLCLYNHHLDLQSDTLLISAFLFRLEPSRFQLTRKSLSFSLFLKLYTVDS